MNEETKSFGKPYGEPFSKTAKFVHWGFIGVFVYALTKQLDEVEELEDAVLLQNEMIFATVFLVILIARFVYIRFTQSSALPAATPKHMMVLAKSVHGLMYVCLAGIAVSGLWIGNMYGAGTKSGTMMEAALLLHEIFVNSTYFLILAHIAGAVYHRRQKDGIWDAMVPFWKEAGGQASRSKS